MTEKKLGQSLLELDARQIAGLPDAHAQTWRVLERDRRRVWWLTALTIALWSAAILMVLSMLVAFALLFPLQAKLREDAQLNRLPPEVRATAQEKSQVVFQMITVGVTCSVGLLALAALATVLLVVASRRATLRQVNASLLEISEQLKSLRLSLEGKPG
jgi:hypothetical protein